jgi:hypothetical protein
MELATPVMYMFQKTDATFENSTLRTKRKGEARIKHGELR